MQPPKTNPVAGRTPRDVDDPATGPADDVSESAIVAGCRRGDADSLERLMALHGGPVRGLLRGIVTDAMAVDGLVQETFLKAFRGMDKFRDGTNLRVWLLTVARNAAYDQLRREKKEKLQPVDIAEVAEPVAPTDDPGERLDASEARARVRTALDALPESERTIVHLRVYEEWTWDAIAEHLAIPEATVRARMNRALQRMRGHLRNGPTA